MFSQPTSKSRKIILKTKVLLGHHLVQVNGVSCVSPCAHTIQRVVFARHVDQNNKLYWLRRSGVLCVQCMGSYKQVKLSRDTGSLLVVADWLNQVANATNEAQTPPKKKRRGRKESKVGVEHGRRPSKWSPLSEGFVFALSWLCSVRARMSHYNLTRFTYIRSPPSYPKGRERNRWWIWPLCTWTSWG